MDERRLKQQKEREFMYRRYYVCPKCGAYLDPGEHCDCARSEITEIRPKEENETEEKREKKSEEV